MAKKKSDPVAEPPPSQAFAVPSGAVDIATIPTSATPIGPQSKSDAAEAMAEIGPKLADLQERLFAQSTAGDRRRVLLILQGMAPLHGPLDLWIQRPAHDPRIHFSVFFPRTEWPREERGWSRSSSNPTNVLFPEV